MSAPRKNLSLVERQPIAVRAAVVIAVTAVVHVLVVAGLVSDDVEKAIASAVDALGALALVLWSIKSSTPNAKVITSVTTAGTVVAGDAAVEPTGTPVQVATSPMGQLVPLASVPDRLVRPGSQPSRLSWPAPPKR